jgi:energy-coupling factor transporter ATP-binding protein EcfA2
VVLADEPTGALERRSADEVLALLRRIHSEGAALLLVTTRQEVAEALPARVLRLEDGRLVAGDPGMPEEPFGTPWPIEALGWNPADDEARDTPAATGAPADQEQGSS